MDCTGMQLLVGHSCRCASVAVVRRSWSISTPDVDMVQESSTFVCKLLLKLGCVCIPVVTAIQGSDSLRRCPGAPWSVRVLCCNGMALCIVGVPRVGGVIMHVEERSGLDSEPDALCIPSGRFSLLREP